MGKDAIIIQFAEDRTLECSSAVIIPVEITGFIQDVHLNEKGEYFLSIRTELPFHDDGTVSNTYHYPSNVDEMTKTVKKSFLESVKESFVTSIPEHIEIPLGSGVKVKGFSFYPHRVLVTPNRGLLMTAEMKD